MTPQRERTLKHTHIWIIVYSGDQVVNKGLQGARHQAVVMVEEAGVALLLGLVQVLVVAAGVQLTRQRRRLRHVVLQRGEQTGTVRLRLSRRCWTTAAEAKRIQNSSQTQTQTAEGGLGRGRRSDEEADVAEGRKRENG